MQTSTVDENRDQFGEYCAMQIKEGEFIRKIQVWSSDNGPFVMAMKLTYTDRETTLIGNIERRYLEPRMPGKLLGFFIMNHFEPLRTPSVSQITVHMIA